MIHMDLVTAKKRAKQFELGGMASLVTGSKGLDLGQSSGSAH